MLTSSSSPSVKDVEFAQCDEMYSNCRVRMVSVRSFQLKREAFLQASILKSESRSSAAFCYDWKNYM